MLTRIRNPRRTATWVVVAASAVAAPAGANAAVTTAVSGDTGALTGDVANDTILISTDNGLLRHNLGSAPGFAGATDFDSTIGGTQTR